MKMQNFIPFYGKIKQSLKLLVTKYLVISIEEYYQELISIIHNSQSICNDLYFSKILQEF